MTMENSRNHKRLLKRSTRQEMGKEKQRSKKKSRNRKKGKRIDRPLLTLSETEFKRKLVKSIKRRQGTKTTISSLRSRLDFSEEKTPRKRKVCKRKLNYSMEEGEIITDVENDENEDCIFIAPTIEEIIIDDEDDAGNVSIRKDTPTSNKEQQNKNVIDLTFTPTCSYYFDTVGVSTPVKHGVSPAKKRSSTKADDSVIFVGETMSDFIPLYSKNVPNPLVENQDQSPIKIRGKRKRKKKSLVPDVNNDLLNKKEKKEYRKYSDNVFMPAPDDETKKCDKRMIVIDGSNVAYSHSINKGFSVKGLKIALDFFTLKGHEVKAVVPQYRMQQNKTSDAVEFQKLVDSGRIVLAPCKNLPGKHSSSYDDRVILQIALEFDAAVVSNDNYRDLLNDCEAFKKIIEQRVLTYTWCNDLFIVVKDPYGRNGPTLDEILKK